MRAVLALLLAAAVGCSGSLRDDAGRIVREGELSTFALRVGDCFVRPTDDDEVVTVDVVPCDRPHDSEVYAIAQFPDPQEAPFPGDETLQRFAEESCLDSAFVDYVGVSYAQSAFEVFPVTPTSDSWAEGDRAVACVLSGAQRTGSARGSGE